jgi:hypothetical protein
MRRRSGKAGGCCKHSSIVGFGLIALGAHINRGIARLLKALELTHGNVSSIATTRQ